VVDESNELVEYDYDNDYGNDDGTDDDNDWDNDGDDGNDFDNDDGNDFDNDDGNDDGNGDGGQRCNRVGFIFMYLFVVVQHEFFMYVLIFHWHTYNLRVRNVDQEFVARRAGVYPSRSLSCGLIA